MRAASDPRIAVEQTVILAAGVGARISGSTDGVPKPLLRLAGVPLIAHALNHAESSGCREAIVVVGHESTRVREAVASIATSLSVRFVENPDPATPNGVSLMAAEPCARHCFFLQMVDHVFAEPVLRLLTKGALDAGIAGRLLVDRAPVGLDLSDATKVRLEGDRIAAIGKGLDPWDAIDTGCFLLTRRIFEALRSVPPTEPRTVSSAMRRLVERQALGAIALEGVRWIDVDTPADRVDAERLLAGPSIPVHGASSALT
jgi:choline kinase